jgi:tripartite-type tricarboxylate transporter receptor subunit TctC
MKLPRREFLRLAAIGLTLPTVSHVAAQSYPTRTIKIIVPATPGSPVDALGRVVAHQLQLRLGQNVVVDNRPGGGMSIGAKAVATAEADGHTLLLVNNGHYFGLTPNAGYDPINAFKPVATLTEWNHVLVMRPDLPVRTVQDLITYAKVNPGKVTFGFGVSTAPHILGETLKNVTGADIASVPYRGGAPAIADLLGGRIDMNFGTTATLHPLIQEGKVRAIAFTGTRRNPDLPKVPTMIEGGIPQLGFDPDVWTGILAPADTPRAVVDKLYAAIDEVLRTPELTASFMKLGFDVFVKQQSDLESFIVSEADKWPRIVKAAGLVPE